MGASESKMVLICLMVNHISSVNFFFVSLHHFVPEVLNFYFFNFFFIIAHVNREGNCKLH